MEPNTNKIKMTVAEFKKLAKMAYANNPDIVVNTNDPCGWINKLLTMQIPEICMAAVQKDGYALQYVKHQTPEICMAAVKQNGYYALKYVKEQTPGLCMVAINQNPHSIVYAKCIEIVN